MSDSTCSTPDCTKRPHRTGRCANHYAAALRSGETGVRAGCKWPDCKLLGTSRGYCQTHYARCRVVGEYETPWIPWEVRQSERAAAQASKSCRWPDCTIALLKGQGLCRLHYGRALNMGNFENPWDSWKPGGICEICGKWMDGPKHGRRYCSEPCNMLGWKRENPERVLELGREHVRRRRAQMRTTQVEKFTDKDIRMAYGDVCYLCSGAINFKLKFPHPKSRSVDHVIPLSRGGSHTLENVAMTHYVCNQIKHAKEAPSAPQPTLFAL